MNWTFKLIIGVNSSIYAFMSGLLISVATSAASSISFAADPNSYHNSIYLIGLCAFLAGILWFLLSERVSSHLRKIERQLSATARATHNTVIRCLPSTEKWITLFIFALALSLSILWPFIRMLYSCGLFAANNYHSLHWVFH